MVQLRELDKLLSAMEINIDLDHIKQIELLQYDAVNFKDVSRLPLSIRTGCDEYKQIPYDVAFHDPEKMLYNEILQSCSHSSYNSVRIKDDAPLMIRSNHGPGIIASLFGCRFALFDNQTPRIEKISLDDAKRIFAKGVPDLTKSLGKKVVETYQYYRERLKPYPKCMRAIHITQPDLRGPYDIFHQMLGNEAFILPYYNSERTKYMIDIISETFIAFRKTIDPYLSKCLNDDAIFAEGLCCGGKVLIKADIATVNLSPDMYQMCEGEPDEFIMESFGGGSLHFCGGSKSWHEAKIINKNLRCVNFGNSELHDLASEYNDFKKNKVAIVGWGCGQGYNAILRDIEKGDNGSPILTGLTLMTEAEDIKQGIEILKRHKDICNNHKSLSN